MAKPHYSKENVQDFFSNPVWFRVLDLIRERKESAVAQLLDTSRDSEREEHRADYRAAHFLETIPQVIVDELGENKHE